MLKRKITKATASVKKFLKSGKNPKKLLMCKVCDTEEVEVSFDIGAVTCARCVQRQVAPPEGIKPKDPTEKFPRGVFRFDTFRWSDLTLNTPCTGNCTDIKRNFYFFCVTHLTHQ